MNQCMRRWSLLAAVVGTLMLMGCSSNKEKSETPAASSQAAPQAAAPSGEAESGESAETVKPAGTAGEIRTQIADQQVRLSAAIQNGKLKDVHHLAFGTRDLVVALADKAKAASSANAAQINDLVQQVKESADKLDELGDAGNLSGTQAEFEKLEKTLKAFNAVTGTR